MFIGDLASGLLGLVVLALLGGFSLLGWAASGVLRFFGVPWAKGIWWGFGVSYAMMGLVLIAVFVSVRTQSASPEIPIEISAPRSIEQLK